MLIPFRSIAKEKMMILHLENGSTTRVDNHKKSIVESAKNINNCLSLEGSLFSGCFMISV